jgi:primosomal protein N'
LYKDKRIRVLFSDRTILELTSNDTCTIITKAGERRNVNVNQPEDMHYYVQIALDYRQWTSLDPSKRKMKIEEQKKQEQQINHMLLNFQNSKEVRIEHYFLPC